MTIIQESITNFFKQQLDIKNNEEQEKKQDSNKVQSIESTSTRPSKLSDTSNATQQQQQSSKIVNQSNNTSTETNLNQHTKNIRIDVNDVSSFTNKNDTSVPSNNKVNDNNKWNWICTLLWNKKSPTITPETQQNINNTKEQNKS